MAWWGWFTVAVTSAIALGCAGFVLWFLVQFAKGFNW